MKLLHIGESFHRFCEIFDGFVCVAMLDAVPDTVLDVSLQNDLTGFVQRRFCRTDLRKDILTVLERMFFCRSSKFRCHEIFLGVFGCF